MSPRARQRRRRTQPQRREMRTARPCVPKSRPVTDGAIPKICTPGKICCRNIAEVTELSSWGWFRHSPPCAVGWSHNHQWLRCNCGSSRPAYLRTQRWPFQRFRASCFSGSGRAVPALPVRASPCYQPSPPHVHDAVMLCVSLRGRVVVQGTRSGRVSACR
jgi:hypothetical protein